MLLNISGADFQHSVIIGNAAQSKNRYVRMADHNQSWLIDRNPDLPPAASGWLAPDLLDIEAARVRSVSIRHEDGETIRLDKASAEDTSYTVADIPEGRELSYATVASGIASVLAELKLEDVRRVGAGELTATSMFTTFDGLEISVRHYRDADDAWIALSANVVPSVAAVDPGAESSPGESAATETPVDDEAAVDNAAADSSGGAAPGASAEEEAATINAQLTGWQFKVADYKANLLTRRWDDILKALDEE